LEELHRQARECLEELTPSSAPPALDWREAWEARVRPFRDLWLLLTDEEALTDAEADEALGCLEQQFGRGLLSAITLHRLATLPEPPPDPVAMDDGRGDQPAPTASALECEAAKEASPPEVAAEPEEASAGPAVPSSPDVSADRPAGRSPLLVKTIATFLSTAEPPALLAVPPAPPIAAETPPPAPTPRDEAGQHPGPPAPEPDELDKPEKTLDEARRADLQRLIWRLVAEDRLGLAYQIARAAALLAPPLAMDPPSALLCAAALGTSVRSSSGELVEQLRKNLEELQAWLPRWQDANGGALAPRLLAFGLALRPTLLAPETGALALLEGLSGVDSLSASLGEICRTLAEFGGLKLELSPSVLKGMRDHAVWQRQIEELRQDARAWLESNRLANIIYAPTTEVWHRWLEADKPLGRTLEILIHHRVARAEEVRHAVRSWSDQKYVERELARTDQEIRKIGSRRRPIEAKARTAICKRAAEFVDLAQRWLTRLTEEPRTRDDFRQQSADRCRSVVERLLPRAHAEVAELAGARGAAAPLAAAVRYVQKALEDLGHLFDASRQENTHSIPVPVLLGEELLALPDVALNESWQPVATEPEVLLRRVEAAAAAPYDPESAFAGQAEVRNHLGTQRVIDALGARPDGQELAERLRARREEVVHQCREALRRKLDETRQLIEQAVCYDLITDEERGRFLSEVADCEQFLDDVSDFASEQRKLEAIDRQCIERRKSRVREVREKLSRLTVPAERHGDLEVVRQALDRGDFLSADEYLELVRKGEPLERTSESGRVVLSEFFRRANPAAGDEGGFAQRFYAFMEGDGRSRPALRDLVDRIRDRRGMGPIDMSGVPGPQAAEAAEMVSAWMRLKNRSGNTSDDLAALLSAFGFRDVQVTPEESPRSPHWLALCRCAPLGDPTVCIVPHFGSRAKGRYRILGIFDRPDEEAIVNLVREAGAADPTVVLYFGRMTEQRRRDLAELCWMRGRSFLTIDEALVFFLCGERFSRLPVLFQCALPFTVAEPYTTTASLVPVEMFFGREQERRAILDPDGTNLVYGGRQLGKSALLRDVERREHSPARDQIVRWIDLKNRGVGIDRPTQDLWAVLGQELHEAKVLERLATNQQTVAERIKDWLRGGDNRRILLLLDEADAFLEADSRAVNEHTRHSFPEVARLKGLMDDTSRKFKVVFAGLHNVQRTARDPNTPLGHLGRPVCIGPLLDNGEWRQARDLIEVPFRHLGYEFQPADLWMRILSYTNYYPSLVQVFCKHLLEYLHNRDRSTFDFRSCPPYPVSAQQIEEVYQSEALQGEIRHKFELTLGLDERYRLIALCIALASIERRQEHALIEGFDVAWVREQALSWWPTGFALDSSYELFRTILDEMKELGVLRKASADRYALRSPNVLNLLGSKSQIEHKLCDVALLPTPPSYEASSFRRAVSADGWIRSPLTAEQEARLIERSNGVVVLYGSPLSGLNELPDALKVIPSQTGVQLAKSRAQLKSFLEWLHEVDKTRSESEGVTLAVVPPEARWSPSWVSAALEVVGRKYSSSKRFLRVIFIADPETAWDLSAGDAGLPPGPTELSLKPWREAAVRRWMEDVEFGTASNCCEQILEQTGGWGLLVHALGEACRGRSHSWREQLESLRRGWPADPRWDECRRLPPGALPALRQMADFEEPVSSGDLADFAPGADVPRVLRWADRLGFAREQEAETWVLDRQVRSIVKAKA
jgi:hypothetical protein